MVWYQLVIHGVSEEVIEPLESLLYDYGACSLTFEADSSEEIFEPALDSTPLWSVCCIKALFTEEALCLDATKCLKTSFENLSYDTEVLPDKAWEREWLKDFKPMSYGKRLWVCPTHCEPPDATAVNILLDPGLAFGTGTHETTALCLRFLDGAEVSDKTVIDFGTGSGILAIASAKLGASKVYATDIDEQAIVATKQNALSNQVENDKIEAFLVDEKSPPQADIVLANILSGTLISLSDSLCELVTSQGLLVLSGILTSQKDDVIKAFSRNVRLQESQQDGDWVMLVFKKGN